MINQSEDEYICACCKGTFTKGWTDEEAKVESYATFSPIDSKEPLAVVCDDCYKLIVRSVAQ